VDTTDRIHSPSRLNPARRLFAVVNAGRSSGNSYRLCRVSAISVVCTTTSLSLTALHRPNYEHTATQTASLLVKIQHADHSHTNSIFTGQDTGRRPTATQTASSLVKIQDADPQPHKQHLHWSRYRMPTHSHTYSIFTGQDTGRRPTATHTASSLVIQ